LYVSLVVVVVVLKPLEPHPVDPRVHDSVVVSVVLVVEET